VRAKYPHLSLGDVIRKTLAEVEGAYAVCFIFAENPNVLIGARKGSPLILGLGKGAVGASNDSMDDTKSSDEEADEPALHDVASECYLASDASAIIEYTNRVVYIEENDIVVIEKQPSGEYFYSIEPIKLPVDEYGCPSPTKKRMQVHSLAMSLDAIEKGGYKHCT
jgi:glutamine---fructose-6-phosphate transaminase (isomerizing)